MKKKEGDKIINEIISSLKSLDESYIEGSWENFQKKRESKKKKRSLLFLLSGAAAIILILLIIRSVNDHNVIYERDSIVSLEKKTIEPEDPEEVKEKAIYDDSSKYYNRRVGSWRELRIKNQNVLLDEPKPLLSLMQHSQIAFSEQQVGFEQSHVDTSRVLTINIKDSVVQVSNDLNGWEIPDRRKKKKFSVGIVMKESVSTTQSSSNVALAVGIVNEINLSKRIALSSGVIYDRYNLCYKQKELFSPDAPTSINAELACFDIPLNIKMKVLNIKQGDIFITGGFSTLAFIKETYREEYRFDSPKITTHKFQNIDFAGQLNFSSGWEYKFSEKFNITIEGYLKIPLYDLGEQDLQFNQSGISIKISK